MNQPTEEKKKDMSSAQKTRAATALACFEHWRQVLRHPNAIFDGKRERLISARLADGFSEEQIKAAIDGNARSEFHQGVNDNGKIYDDISLICRDAGHVESFIAMGAHNAQRRAPQTANGRRLQECLDGIARRARGENGSDHSAIALPPRLALLR